MLEDRAGRVGEDIIGRDPRDPELAGELVTYLGEHKLLEKASGERALQAQKRSHERIDVVLTELGLLSAADLHKALSGFLGMPTVDRSCFPLEPVSLEKIQTEYIREARLVPLGHTDNGPLLVATDDPFATEDISKLGFWADVETAPRLATRQDIDAALARLYPVGTENKPERVVSRDGQYASEEDLQRLLDIASEAPIIRLVNRLISDAVNQRASDIHIEPLADSIRIRYRIDGLLSEVERLPPEAHAGVATRIKVIAKLNIAERRLPQDGRAEFVVLGRKIDLRVSTTPTLHGESLVLRILDKAAVNLTFPALGLKPDVIATFEALLARPNGILLVTGPTGSGKTTTLYAALTALNSVKRKIFSVEDPIEYELPGVNQSQVKPGIGLDFPQVLRSILRQDPDVIMIGEMRDTETARIGIQASLTGHLVLATLHTNSAAAAVTRLLDMGIEDYLLASTLSGVMAQRLVRRLCPLCAQPSRDFDLAPIPHDLGTSSAGAAAPSQGCTAVGCQACHGTGYRGRIAITEILTVDDVVRPLIRRGVTDKEIASVAASRGMATLLEAGQRLVSSGETTLEEVLAAATH